MISLQEIKKAQKPKKEEWFFGYHVTRRISKYITFFLLKIFGKRNNPNLITIFSLILGLTGAILLSFPDNLLWIIGSFLCFGFFVLDCVDGEIARILKKTSLLGKQLDFLSHPIFNGSLLIFSSLGIARYLGINAIIYLGIFAGILIILSDIIRIIEEEYDLNLLHFSSTNWQDKNFLLGAVKSLFSFQSFVFVLFWISLADYFVKFNYCKIALFLFVYLYVIFLFIKRFNSFVWQIQRKQ